MGTDVVGFVGLAALLVTSIAWLRADTHRYMDRLESRLNERMDRFEARMDRFEAHMDRLEAGQGELRERMARLEGMVDGLREAVAAVRRNAA